MKGLQFGHGVLTVEDGMVVKALVSNRDMLQFGHGVLTVEDTASTGGQPYSIELQFGHGVLTVEDISRL